MPSIYALLVGINDYQAVRPLSGCRNDVDRVGDYLRSGADADRTVHIRTLTDRDATRAAIIAAFRDHLGRGRPGDTALFWFSGHGSRAALPEELWTLEPSGTGQTLVCADSRAGGRPDLLDRELGLLLSEVARRGVHTVAVLDCCHSAGGTRQAARPRPDPAVSELIALGAPLAARWVEPASDHHSGTLRPELSRGVGAVRRPDHVALAACRNHQFAYEVGPPDNRRGAFTAGLLDALDRLGPRVTYRNLLIAARCQVENTLRHQVPVLYPPESELIDQPFLGGALHRPTSPIMLSHVHGGWQIDAGRIHGLVPGDVRVAPPGDVPPREARVVEVFTERSRVEPLGWRPDPGRQYPVVFSHVPVPPATVAVGGRPGDDPAVARAVSAGLATTGPGGTPSPYVREAALDEEAALRVSASDGRIRITGFDGSPMTRDLSPYGIGGVVSALEHIARWRTVRTLTGPRSGLAGAVRLDVVPAGPGAVKAPSTGGAIVPGGEDGAVRLRYERHGEGWRPPRVFLRLHNLTGRRLYCVLLDLTDRYEVHPDLFPGDYVGPGRTAAAFDGDPVEFALPDDVPVAPGGEARDWIQVIVAEEEFGSDVFRLGPLGARHPAAGGRSGALSGLLDLLGREAMHRDIARPARSAYEWATTLVPVVTRVEG